MSSILPIKKEYHKKVLIETDPLKKFPSQKCVHNDNLLIDETLQLKLSKMINLSTCLRMTHLLPRTSNPMFVTLFLNASSWHGA